MKRLMTKWFWRGALIACLSAVVSCGSGGGAVTRYLFMTSDFFTVAQLGGAAGADTKCATYASGGGLSGTFKAYITSGTATAASRLSDVGPWYLVGTTTVAATNLATFVTGFPTNTNFDQNGTQLISATAYWTGMAAGGVVGSTCDDWTNTTSGNGNTANQLADVQLSGACASGAMRVMCVQQ